MKTIATTLQEKITLREPIELSRQTSTRIPLALFFVFFAMSIVTGYALLASQGATPLFFTVSAFFLGGMVYFLSFVWKIIGSAYIKNDMLIVKYSFGKFKVTELRSIRGVKTLKVLGLRLTSIRFKVDGTLYKVVMFGPANYLQDPKTIINTLRKAA
ncbi:MAG TPA: hypothetical protein VK151_17465 [Fluviicola sp.]|nr:hypothetical protein [Fluviicola sp.]